MYPRMAPSSPRPALAGAGAAAPASRRLLALCSAAALALGLLCAPSAHGFNLDTASALTKAGEEGSLFGLSVALHRQLTPEPRSWILVGAPQARGRKAQRSTRPGALFRCPISEEEHDCKRVDIDGDVQTDRESKHNQWLGVTVKSQGIGGKVVTCAHLYELRQRVTQPSETRDPIGRCYVLSEDLTERDDLDGGEWKFCEGRPQGHEQFGFCQQGVAASFTPDNNFILFGAPGTYNWKGLLFMASPVEDALVYKTLEPSARPTIFEDVAQNSYLGFSVDSAMSLMSKAEMTFVAGAPRANHTGAVVLLRKDNVYRLVPQHILWGEELGSSFGYSVATADFNSDGWTDLVVGAPNFFDRRAEIGGAVYVYLNPGGSWADVTHVRLNGAPDSMFGLIVANLGDLNRDGFEDLAVGSPFDGAGKVFIYHGSSSGIETKPTQTLDGKRMGMTGFGYSISGGVDMDGNLYPDVAVGSLNDQVALFRSSPVVKVQWQVVTDPQNIDLENPSCKEKDGVCVDVQACFSYSAVPETYSPNITLEVLVEVEAELRKLNLPQRVSFLSHGGSEPDHHFSKEVELHGQGFISCSVATLLLQENLKDKLRPISVSVSHRIKRREPDPDDKLGELDPVLSPTFPDAIHTEVNFLREGCGPDKFCQSNLQMSYQFGVWQESVAELSPLPVGEDGVPVFALSDRIPLAVEVTLTNAPSDPGDPMADGDDAHAALLQLTFPKTLSYYGIRTLTQVGCKATQNGSECDLGNPVKRDAKLKFAVLLSSIDISIETSDLSIDFLLSTISEQAGLAPVSSYIKLVFQVPMTVSGEADPRNLLFSGTVKGERAMETVEEVGSPVEIKFTLNNPGKPLQKFGTAFLNIMWPHELANGKWLLYPTGFQFEGHPHSGCVHTNPLGLNITDPNVTEPAHLQVRRTGRSHSEEEGQKMTKSSMRWTSPAVAASESRKTLQLDCLLGSARCMLFRCPLHGFTGSAKLKIQGRLWNSTFIEEFSSFSSLELLVRANITIKSTIKHLFLKKAETKVSVMIYPEHTLADQPWIPWWIILIAILAGILVLALLVCILWKCGFFKRTERRPQYQTEYHRAQLQVQPSEAEKQASEQL